jgi:hypothetical protein
MTVSVKSNMTYQGRWKAQRRLRGQLAELEALHSVGLLTDVSELETLKAKIQTIQEQIDIIAPPDYRHFCTGCERKSWRPLGTVACPRCGSHSFESTGECIQD